jgi:RNA polymerase sigma-70 factor, ECF subfamily
VVSAGCRIAWMLRRVEGLPLAEVATLCDCSLATAKRRITDADRCVAAHVGGEWGEP